ncbi:MAG TPA: dethiobiotin synthase [Casimicrobiaceae bacterium]|jgi:dethiobiotin synthetase|nr:dethiobiotin synthase [Casimicrobiaceae bacterium]
MTGGLFITGTDTGVGKTVVACAVLRSWVAQGRRAVGMKPVAAGIAAGAACNEDVAALAAAGNVEAPLSVRNPFAFAPAIAPQLAAAEAGVAIDLKRIRAAYEVLAARADCVAVEGAGGVLVPLDARRDMLDIALTLSLPVLLVVAVRLGCLNHALLSAHAIHCRGLAFAGWVANLVEPKIERTDANIAALEERLPAPRIATIAWAKADAPQWSPDAGALGLG